MAKARYSDLKKKKNSIQVKRIFETGRCFYCDCELLEPAITSFRSAVHERLATIDHFYNMKNSNFEGLSLNRKDNLVLSCHLCNIIKSDIDPIEFGMFVLIHIRPIRKELPVHYHKIEKQRTGQSWISRFLRCHKNMKQTDIEFRPVEF